MQAPAVLFLVLLSSCLQSAPLPHSEIQARASRLSPWALPWHLYHPEASSDPVQSVSGATRGTAQTSEQDGIRRAHAAIERGAYSEAIHLLNECIKEHPEHLEARYLRGIAYREKEKSYTLLSNALSDLQRVIEQDSLFLDVLYQYALTLSYRQQYARDLTEAILLAERQLQLKPELEEARLGVFHIYRAFTRAWRTSRALAWLRGHRSPYARFFEAVVLYDKGAYAEADHILAELMPPATATQPSTLPLQPLLLWRGRLSYAMDKPERAQDFIMEAIQSIDSAVAARFLYDDFKYILDLEEQKIYAAIITPQAYRAFFARLWIKRNPMPAFEVNLRLMEHYRRLAFAERYYLFNGFRAPYNNPARFKKLALPATHALATRLDDRGIIFVRHGEPDDRQFSETMEVWRYYDPGLRFTFSVQRTGGITGVGNFRFTGGNTWAGLTTDRHRWPDSVKAIDFPYLPVVFRASDGQTTFELHYALPLRGIVRRGRGADTAEVAVGMALHDPNWNEVFSRTGTLLLNGEQEKKTAEAGFFHVTIQPGLYHVALHAGSLSTKYWGGYRFKEDVPDFSGAGLQMSSLLPASYIGPARPENRYNRGELYVEVNPSGRFLNDQFVYIYFEVYGLTYGSDDQTRYSAAYTLRSIKKKKSLLFGGRDRDVVLTLEMEGAGTTMAPVEYAEMDVSRIPAGDYLLEVTVTDENTGASVTRSIEIELKR